MRKSPKVIPICFLVPVKRYITVSDLLHNDILSEPVKLKWNLEKGSSKQAGHKV